MSAYQCHLVPVFADNYIFIIENTKTRKCAVVDPGASDEVIEFVKQRQLQVEAILITHHHWDHIDGVSGLIEFCKTSNVKVKIFAPEKNKKDIPQADYFVKEGDRLTVVGQEVEVLDLPGHTLGHIGYYVKEEAWLFSGDVVFGLGCGRLFEGTPEQQFDSLGKIKKLNENTKIFCTHEYTERNLAFCKKVLLPTKNILDSKQLLEYENSLTSPSVPLSLSKELKCNPFLVTDNIEEFTEIRKLRDRF